MSTSETFGWRRIAVPAFGPTFLSAAASGAVVPIAALRADELGASLGLAAFVVSLTGIGQLVGVLPAGALVARIGDEVTVKRFERQSGSIRLLPENPDFAPIDVSADESFTLEGLAVGLVRNTLLM